MYPLCEQAVLLCSCASLNDKTYHILRNSDDLEDALMNEKYLFKLQEDLQLKNFTKNTCDDYYRFVKRFLDFTGKEAMSITYAHIRKFIFQRNFSALYHFFHIIVLILSFYSGKQKKLCLLIYFLVFVYNFPFSFMIHSYFCHNFLLY